MKKLNIIAIPIYVDENCPIHGKESCFPIENELKNSPGPAKVNSRTYRNNYDQIKWGPN